MCCTRLCFVNWERCPNLPIYIPVIIWGHKLRAASKRVKLKTQEAEMSFLPWLCGLTLRNWTMSLEQTCCSFALNGPDWGSLGIWSRLLDVSLRYSRHQQETPGQNHNTLGLCLTIWPGRLGMLRVPPGESGGCELNKGHLGYSTLLNLLPPLSRCRYEETKPTDGLKLKAGFLLGVSGISLESEWGGD